MPLRISFKTSPQRVDWATLDATWRLAGELGGWDGAWLNDHLTDMDPDVPGPSPGGVHARWRRWSTTCPGCGSATRVLSNTFRHPVLLAKAATVLDHATGGRFVVGLGAGWFEGEHEPFGIPLPPIGERIDRLVSAVEVLRRCSRRRRRRRPASRGRTRSTRWPVPSTPRAAHPGRTADLPGRAEAARHRAGGAAAAGWLLTGHRGRRRGVLRRPPRRRSSGRSRPSAATPPRSSSWARCTPAPMRLRGHGRSSGAGDGGGRGHRDGGRASRRRWGRGRWRTRTGTSWGRCARSSGRAWP